MAAKWVVKLCYTLEKQGLSTDQINEAVRAKKGQDVKTKEGRKNT
jgi:hypothetical protein